MKVIDKFLNFLIYLSLFCIITGGLFIQLNKNIIDISSITVPLILITFIFLISKKLSVLEKLTSWSKLESFINFIKKNSTKKNLFILLILIGGLIFCEHLLKYLNYRVATADAVFVNQSLFHPFGEEILQCDICWGGSRLSNHLGLSLLLYAPIISLLNSEIFIIFMQVIPLFLVIYFFITKGPLKDKSNLWLVFAFYIISHQAFRNALVWDFKEDHIGSLFLFLSLLSLYNRKFILSFGSIIITFISKEHTAFIIPMLSFPIWFEKDLALSKKERIWIIIIINILSLIWVLSVFKILFPMFRPAIEGHKPPLLNRLGVPGNNEKEILTNLFFNPSIWWMLVKTKILKLEVLKYIFLLYLPFVYLLRKRWWWLVATLSVLAMNLVSNFDTMRSLAFHYEVYIMPMLLLGVGISMRYLKRQQLIWGLLLFLLVSDRWPMRGIVKNIEGVTKISDSWYYSNLDDDKKYIAGKFILPHISHLSRIQRLIPDKYLNLDEYIKSEQFKNLLSKNTDLAIFIDTKRAEDQRIKQLIIKNGFKKKSSTPSQRADLYIKNPLNQN